MAPRARTTDPTTSHDAAASVQNVTETMRRILSIFHDAGRPFTDESLCARFHGHFGRSRASDSSIRSRRKELTDLAFVRVLGSETLPSGRRARTFVITEPGKRYIIAHPIS